MADETKTQDCVSYFASPISDPEARVLAAVIESGIFSDTNMSVEDYIELVAQFTRDVISKYDATNHQEH